MIYLFCVLATWRITYMLVEEIGPGRIFERIRHVFTSETLTPVVHGNGVTYAKDRVGKNIIGDILICVYCASVWLSIPFAILLSYKLNDWLMLPAYWLGLSAGAILVEVIRRKLDK